MRLAGSLTVVHDIHRVLDHQGMSCLRMDWDSCSMHIEPEATISDTEAMATTLKAITIESCKGGRSEKGDKEERDLRTRRRLRLRWSS
jgi:hypothetical protein